MHRHACPAHTVLATDERGLAVVPGVRPGRASLAAADVSAWQARSQPARRIARAPIRPLVLAHAVDLSLPDAADEAIQAFRPKIVVQAATTQTSSVISQETRNIAP